MFYDLVFDLERVSSKRSFNRWFSSLEELLDASDKLFAEECVVPWFRAILTEKVHLDKEGWYSIRGAVNHGLCLLKIAPLLSEHLNFDDDYTRLALLYGFVMTEPKGLKLRSSIKFSQIFLSDA